ncbi:hypothetical protein Rsub_03442 [Raphidocelis subcapitata]|uniref:Uncharacterized protein n=1 Tax=Raphidocelis subcapitata TaxID=307507 RepID=A0A2V0NS40_9CHLO|nr:hypothetical protein Rsub_03442 [Raphidocelis subcapitata]|eukprot:GBF90446.1 hypothetical protein Rsub_03442 [Raphidocelis subcapitata]
MLGGEGRGRRSEGAPRVEELPEGHNYAGYPRTAHPVHVEEPDDEDYGAAHYSREEREPPRARRRYDPPGHSGAHGQQQYGQQQYGQGQQQQQQQQQQYGQPQYGQHYGQRQQYQHQQPAAAPPPFVSPFGPPPGFPFGGGSGGGLPFGGMGMGMMGGFDSMFNNMFARMEGMVRHMDQAARSAADAAARGALPEGCHYVSQSQTYDSSGARTSATTRAAGGVREWRHSVEDGGGQQRCTVARAIGDRERVVTRERGPDGRFVTREEVRGGVRDGAAFEEEWRAAAEARLPRGGQQQMQQSAALPAPGEGYGGGGRGAPGHHRHGGR